MNRSLPHDLTRPAPPTHTAYVGLGSNLGDRRAHLDAALAELGRLPNTDVSRVSRFHDTPPLGPPDQGRFLNAVAELRTALPPRELLDRMLDIESRLGRPPRDQRTHWGPRTIDLDLLLHGDTILDQAGLTLPHPGMAQRRFVLEPLAELAPQLLHPSEGRTVSQLLAACEAVEVSG